MARLSHGMEISLMRQVYAAIALGAALDDALARIVRTAARLCRAPIAYVAVLSAMGDELSVVNGFPRTARMLGARLPVVARSLAITPERGWRSRDVLHDRRQVVRDLAGASGMRGALVVPLRSPRGPLGILSVGTRTPHRFTDRDAAVLSQLSDAASIAVQHAQLVPQRPVNETVVPRRRTSSRLIAVLTDRQRQIMELLVAGKTAKEIAAAIGLSTRTVEHHLERLKRRHGASRRATLIAALVSQRGVRHKRYHRQLHRGAGWPSCTSTLRVFLPIR